MNGDFDFFDFQVFMVKLLSSLTPNVPLEDNLQAVMSSLLWRLKQQSNAPLAVHVFPNPDFNELHAMVLGSNPASEAALEAEMERRHRSDEAGLVPVDGLPRYTQVRTRTVFAGGGEERVERAALHALPLLKQLRKEMPEEFAGLTPAEDDSVVFIPLNTPAHRRLGYFLLWAPAESLRQWYDDPEHSEGLAAFRRSAQQLIVRLFSNFYRMEPCTYLPSYYQTECKPVALLCAEIRSFDRIAELVRRRRDARAGHTPECLGRLIRGFTEVAARAVEQNRGRVDQIWGSGLIAVFGEYLDTPGSARNAGCIRAVAAASSIAAEFPPVARQWLQADFHYDEFRLLHNELVEISPVIAVTYGEVAFDYVGSPNHRVYMAVGDTVGFVKQLADAGSRSSFDQADPSLVLREVRDLLRDRSANTREDFRRAPILISQTAYESCKDMLQSLPGRPVGEVHTPHIIALPGRATQYPVYAVWPENVQARSGHAPLPAK